MNISTLMERSNNVSHNCPYVLANVPKEYLTISNFWFVFFAVVTAMRKASKIEVKKPAATDRGKTEF